MEKKLPDMSDLMKEMSRIRKEALKEIEANDYKGHEHHDPKAWPTPFQPERLSERTSQEDDAIV